MNPNGVALINPESLSNSKHLHILNSFNDLSIILVRKSFSLLTESSHKP